MKVICGSLALTVSLFLMNLAWAGQEKDQPKKEDSPKKEEPKQKKKPKERVYEVGTGLTIDSKLDDKDAKDSDRKTSYSKVFLVKMVKGKTYQIDMRTQAFDAYLRLEDAGKKQLAEDDDSGGCLDAQINFTAPEDAVYRVIATSFDADETGPFSLRIQEK